jgi:dTDP-4-amino-4,6-dideoxygalactose transaminase
METPLNLKAERVIRVAKPSITDKEIRAVHDCLISGQISAGPLVEQFEHDFAALHDRKYGVTCNSGTSALTLALLAIGAESVVMPTLTMVACANAALSAGCTPKFVDHGKWNVKADCYLPVHLYGVPDETINYSLSHVVEDCAEANFGKFQNGQSVGSRGKLACFSLFANKIITCCEGGIVLTDDWDMAERLKSLRAHAFTKGEHFHHKEFALGVRMTEIQAAFGLAQLERKNTIVNTRRRLAESILAQLSSVWWLEFMPRPTGSAWWVVPILVRKESPYTKDDVRAHLARNGVETRSFFKPMHQQPHLERYASGKYPIANDLSKRGFYLPLHPELSSEDIDFMCGLLRDMK